MSVTQIASPNPVLTGSNVTYTMTVTNLGPGTAESLTVTDNLPATSSEFLEAIDGVMHPLAQQHDSQGTPVPGGLNAFAGCGVCEARGGD